MTGRSGAAPGAASGAAVPGPGLLVDEVEGAARRAGVRAGDRIVTVDGRRPEDVLDLSLAAADGGFELGLERDGRPLTLPIRLRRGEGHGLALRDGLGVPVRRCANDCPFCFVAQVPPGLRPSLSVRDDDYRLSFLQGTFITLTNLSEHDLERIVALRLSPLYVSLHAWDDGVRARLMGPGAGRAREQLARLVAGGVGLHVQVVLCPGLNDGPVLCDTVEHLLALAAGAGPDPNDAAAATSAGVIDVGVVPVSLASAAGGLRPPTPADASTAVALVGELQVAAAARLGRRFVHAADELYLRAGAWPPAGDAPEQYENGVGICAALLDEVEAIAPVSPPPRVALLGGVAAAPVLAAASRRLAARTGAAVRPFIVANRLFGPHVTVTGLLGGREVADALRERPLAVDEWLLAPRTVAPEGLGRTLDDVSEAELAAACGGRLALGPDLAGAWALAERARR